MYEKITAVLRSRAFWYVMLGICAAQGLWMAFSGAYPMAFDEEHHLGIIKLYAAHGLPFWSEQPANADIYGGVYRDPSYLFHYLLSFPFRLISVFWHDETSQTVVLRIFNVAMFTGAMAVFRKVFLAAKVPRAITQLSLAFVILMPISPLLAGQLNYDNALLLMSAWSFLLLIQVLQDVWARKVRLVPLVSLALVAMTASLVKYAFLPILATISLIVLVALWRGYTGQLTKLRQQLTQEARQLSRPMRIILAILVVVVGGLFIERYGVNTIKYHTPIPECDQVLSVERCQVYGPWVRNYRMVQSNEGDVALGFFGYLGRWEYGVVNSVFYALNGKYSGYVRGESLWFPELTALVLLGVGTLGWAFNYKRLLRANRYYGIFAIIIGVYALSLWAQNYSEYVRLGQPVAIQGRYLIQIMPLLAVLIVVGLAALLKQPKARLGVLLVSTVLFLQGAGLITFWIRSDSSWYLQNRTVIQANETAQDITKPLIIGD